MKIERLNKEARLEFFKELYESSKNACEGMYSSLSRSMEQYRGSFDIDGSEEAATTIRNITYEIVESQISSDIPMPRAEPSSYSEARGRNAEAIERLLRSVRDKLPFEMMNDIDERYTYIYGGSIWYVEWDNSLEHLGEVGGVKVHVISPRDFIPQPSISSVEDMEYCFLRFTTTRGELIRKYGVSEEASLLAELEIEGTGGNLEGDTVSLITAFYRDEDGDVGRFIFSGELTLSDLPKYYMRKGEVCSICGEELGECECFATPMLGEIRSEVLMRDLVLPSGVRIPRLSPDSTGKFHRTKIPYYVPKLFPIVIRKNTSGEGTLLGQSDCDYIRPEQQAINKIRRIYEHK